MTDGPIASFALGTLAVSRGVSETAALAMAVCNRSATSVNTTDLQALIAEIQYLRELNTALIVDVAALETYSDQLRTWGRSLQDRLNAVSG